MKYPIPKLDLITVPQFFGGAMENWGGMTFTESTVVYDPKLQTPSQQRRIFDIIAHETSHQWNGDEVTMGWWDSLWLNEGFATWMEAKSTAELNPTWNWWLGFDSATNGSLVADARLNTTKVQVPVRNETEANTIFDPEIAYQKAGAFLRMMEAYLGPETFRAGLHRYFVANSFNSSVPQDLWRALSNASHQDVAAIADSWINQPGFPVVTVTATCDGGKRSLALAQHRYASFDDHSTTVWSIPLNVETGDGKTTPVLFDKPSATIPGGQLRRAARTRRRRPRVLSRRLRSRAARAATEVVQDARRRGSHLAARRFVAVRGGRQVAARGLPRVRESGCW